MAPTFDKPNTKEEKKFVKAAEASARMPFAENRKKAREAYNNLPKNSPFKEYSFEG
jgi:hypothetical protein